MVSMESDVKILKQAAGNDDAYSKLLAAASEQEAANEEGAANRTLCTKEFPTILEVLKEMGGEAVTLERMKQEEDGLLRYWGKHGEMLLPTLDTSELRKKLGVEKLTEVTFSVGVNSDCYNQGLGIGIEASPMMNCTVDERGIPSYCYNGYGIEDAKDLKRNVIKFHPGMHGAELRVEGVGGFDNQGTRQNPESLNQVLQSGKSIKDALHTVKVTVRADGKNTVHFKANGSDSFWTCDFQHQLFDGEFMPSVFAFLDMGGNERDGVIYSRISVTAC
eukprot:TRINITY_DN10543_c0_g3_i1.p1 TRINITY_DN10543_c0_g3~~TRINITY_DN10543_c0_g3_i1.p1  ORF type:complete len:276 (-),score=52.10 TRINITY_DN10543_c0_g3_i1:121-948(-)